MEKEIQKKRYVVDYQGWLIHVWARNKKQAKYLAWLDFSRVYTVSFIDFLYGINEVAED